MKSMDVKKILYMNKAGKVGIPTRMMGNKQKMGMGALLVAGVVAGIAFKFGGQVLDYGFAKLSDGKGSTLSDVALSDAEKEAQAIAEPNAVVVDSRSGVSASISMSAYDKQADSLTEVYPTWFVTDESGTILLNGVGNSTTSVKGETVSFAIIGSTYLGGEYPLKLIETEAPSWNFDVHTLSAETSMVVKVMDSDNTALTADNNVNNTADYSQALGPSQGKTIQIKLSNEDSDSVYPAGGIATFSNNDCDSIEIVDSRLTKVASGKEISKASIVQYNDVNTSYTITGYDALYTFNDPVTDGYLEEWKDFVLSARINAGSVDPTANTGDFCGGVFVDIGYEDNADGKVEYGIFKQDQDEQATAVGISDTLTSPQGLTSGFVIELQ